MSFFIYLLSSILLAVVASSSVYADFMSYKISSSKNFDSSTLHVLATLEATDKDLITLRLPSAFPNKCIINKDNPINALGLDLSVDYQNCQATIYHTANKNITLSYNITTTTSSFTPLPSPFGPVIKDSYFFTSAGSLLLFPLADGKNLTSGECKIVWNLSEPLSKITTNFKNTIKKGDVASLFFIGGNYTQDKISKGLGVSYIGISRKEFKSNFEGFIVNSWHEMTKLFSFDKKLPLHYMINLVIENDIQSEDDFPIGIGNKDNTSIFMYNLKKGFSDFRASTVFIHEFLHKWIGSTFTIEHYDWFNEGFTDYYAKRINAYAHGLKLSEYIEDYNRLLVFLHTYTPCRSITYSHDLLGYSIQKLIGQSFASRLNYMVHKNSEGKYCLDNIMRDMHKISLNEEKKEIELEDFKKIGNKYWSGFKNYVEDYLMYGKLKNYDGELGKCVKLSSQKFAKADYGFDHVQALQNRLAMGIDEKHVLYKKGLRNSFQLLKAEILDRKNPFLPIKLVWKNSEGIDTSHTIYRTSHFVEVPQFELDVEMYRDDPKGCLEYFKIHSISPT